MEKPHSYPFTLFNVYLIRVFVFHVFIMKNCICYKQCYCGYNFTFGNSSVLMAVLIEYLFKNSENRC